MTNMSEEPANESPKLKGFGSKKPMPWNEFLEKGPLAKELQVQVEVSFKPTLHPGFQYYIDFEDLEDVWLPCTTPDCPDRIRHKHSGGRIRLGPPGSVERGILEYKCVQCSNVHSFALIARRQSGVDKFTVEKFGQSPPLGGIIPKSLSKLADGRAKELLFKGYECMWTGYGVGAFAYFRLAVEELRTKVLGEIRKSTTDPAELKAIDEALGDMTFAESLDHIKDSLPEFGKGKDNLLKMLWRVLSEGIHDDADDAENLAVAMCVIDLLEVLIDRIHSQRQGDEKLKASADRLREFQAKSRSKAEATPAK